VPDLAGEERGRNAVSTTDPGIADSNQASDRRTTNGLLAIGNWPLRAKLVAVFVLPTVAALFLAGMRIYDGFADAAVYERAQQRIELSQKISAAVHELQAERQDLSAWIVAGRPADRAELDTQTRETDQAVTAVRDAEQIVSALDDTDTAARFEQAVTRLDSLGELRVSARDSGFPASAALISYTAMVDALQTVSADFEPNVTNKALQDRHEAFTALAAAKEYSSQQNAYLRNAAVRGQFDTAELNGILTAEANLVSAIENFTAAATADNRQLYSGTVSGDEVSRRFRLQELALQRAGADQPVGINATAVAQSSDTTLDLVRDVEVDVLADEAAYTENLLSSVRQELIITSVVMLAGVLLALGLMVLVARSLLRPLRTLRANALEVAHYRLPEAVQRIMRESDPRAAAEKAVDPVPVQSNEEIGQVARAFDVVHGRAVRLAAEQALLRENVNGIFVNLSRRSQRLVERQLGVIDRLEAEEQDPDQLASLFELDHLATRLRRNGESLLVLSGAGLTKSVPRPVPAADVIGAAVSEIEQYARVEVGVIPDVAVQGLAIHDLVHLLAELLDNATYFSEPETRVTVRAVVTRKSALAVQITDRGVGMSEEEIAEANERLADPPDLDVSVTRRMGLYVVARLAKRHGIEVRLRENEDIEGGVIARVVVPAGLLTTVPPAERTIPPRNSAAESHAEVSWPGASATAAAEAAEGAPARTPADAEPTVVRAEQPMPPMGDDGWPAPLEEPISLDELVGGAASAAGPFVSPTETTQAFPQALPPVNGTARDERQATGDARDEPPGPAPALGLPKRQPSYIPVAETPPAGNGQQEQQGSELEDEVPTRRLPIYQSVLSRWFSEADDTRAAEPEADDTTAERPQAVDAETGNTGSAAGRHEAASGSPAPATGWQSVSDEGWNAAQSLLESKGEEVTSAGLPKRVPNAYLVPGSVSPQPGLNAFADATTAAPGKGALARSASVARNRMASFQRGYQTGRHALKDDPADNVGDSGAGEADAGKFRAGEPDSESSRGESSNNGVKE
jgi:signal transduction histidine kinase